MPTAIASTCTRLTLSRRLPACDAPRPTFAQSTSAPHWPLLVDFAVFAGVVAIFYAFARSPLLVHRPVAEAVIERSPRALPIYAFYSLVRMASPISSASPSRSPTATSPLQQACRSHDDRCLDVLQSIRYSAFFPESCSPPSLFSHPPARLELGSIILIFTGQVWNIAFSFYSSLKAIPASFAKPPHLRFSRCSASSSWSFPSAPLALSGIPWSPSLRDGSRSCSARCLSSTITTSVSPARLLPQNRRRP